jgi:SAM-dependent methyltransferase
VSLYDRSAVLYDAMYRGIGKDYAAESDEVAELVLGRRPDARTLLDVACGTGGHLEHLRHRFAVTGLERSRHMAALARQKLPDVEVHEGDMRRFDLGATFDAVTCLFGSIGYMGTTDDLARALTAMVASLSPGGVLVVDPWLFPERWVDGHVGAVAASEPGMAVARVTTSHRLGRLSVLEFHYTAATADGVDRFSERHEMGLFTRAEYEAAFLRAGAADVVHEPGGFDDRGRFVATRT